MDSVKVVRYIYWPDGILEIRREGRQIFFGHPIKGEALFGTPRPGDEILQVADWQDGSWRDGYVEVV